MPTPSTRPTSSPLSRLPDPDVLIAPCGPFEPAPVICVATSGGPDSQALLWVLSVWASRRKGTVLALFVDHGWRNVQQDFKAASTLAQRLGVEIRKLDPSPAQTHKPPSQARARDLRYRALLKATRQHHSRHLFLAHHQYDQSETALWRLERGGSVFSLAAMRRITMRQGVRLLRPLLLESPVSLRQCCHDHHLPFVDDPANQNPSFRRTFWRQQWKQGHLDPASIARTTEILRSNAQALEHMVIDLLSQHLDIHPNGMRLPRSVWNTAPKTVQFQIVWCLLHCDQQRFSGSEITALLARIAHQSSGRWEQRGVRMCWTQDSLELGHLHRDSGDQGQ